MAELITIQKEHYDKLINDSLKVARAEATVKVYKETLKNYPDSDSKFINDFKADLQMKINMLEQILNG